MKVITEIEEMQQTANELRQQGRKIGVVLTMGYLHEGHLSLIRIAKQRADVVITTIFVNPTQFAPHEDFNSYPRDIERDKKLASDAGTDILFVPKTEKIYPPNYLTFVEVEKISKVLEGKFRPTHFRGVTTIVTKLFNITKPHLSVFGQKDAQQAIIIQQMVRDLNFDIEIIIAPIVREPDGLALSSRNVYLSENERQQSTILFKSLQYAANMIASGERNCSTIINNMKSLFKSAPSATIDYISIADPQTLQEYDFLTPGKTVLISLAVRFNKARLIDNILVTV